MKVASPKNGIVSDSGKIANLVFRSLRAAYPDSPNIKIDDMSSGVYRDSQEFFGQKETENILSETVGARIIANTSTCQPGMFCVEAGH
ncbi:MAG TPA: hypothetical protein P5262_02345 [Candidatus Moranbacteria bacterium]|nr:hypothetical protein [Candidatus Moranbacteria bacterium]